MSARKLVMLLAVAAALLGAVPSMAAEATPESFKEAVEPI